MSVQNGRTSCFPVAHSTSVRLLSEIMGKARSYENIIWTKPCHQRIQLTQLELALSLNRVISDHLLSVSSGGYGPCTFSTEMRPFAIIGDYTLFRTPMCRGLGGATYCWNATPAGSFQSPDSGSNPCHFGLPWNEAIACSLTFLGWTGL